MRLRARVTIALLPALLLSSCGHDAQPSRATTAHSSSPSTPTATEGPLVVFLGDSLAAGLHLDASDAFPAVLQRTLTEQGVPFRLINAGVSGDTTAGGLRRVDWLLKQQPDWVVLELGANDGLRGVQLTAIEANLRAIIAKVQAAGAGVLLLGLCLPPNYGGDYTSGFLALYERIADDLALPFVPCFIEGVGGVAELNLSDGIHPTAEGQRKLAEKLAPVLARVLSESG